MKPIIVGLHNPYSSDPADALVPYPERSAGHRLWRMLASLPDTAVPVKAFHVHLWDHAYRNAFDRRNLCARMEITRKSQRDYAKRCAHMMTRDIPTGATVVLLGREVLDAFNDVLSAMLYPILIHPQVVDGITWRWLPHPSGRVTQYNDPVIRALAGLMLADVLAATGEQ